MSTERDVQTPSGEVIALTREQEEKEFRAKMVSIASRSVIQAGLVVNLPDDLYGEWIANDKLSTYEAKNLGFDFPPPEIVEAAGSLHDDGTGRIITGDVVFMTMPRWKKNIIEEEKLKRAKSLNSMKKGESPEERLFLDNAQGRDIGIETFNESSVHVTTKTR